LQLRFCTLAGATLSASPKGDFTWFEAGVVEILYTAMLAFVVLSVGTAYRQNPSDNPNQFYALAIGFVIAAGGFAAGGISGGAFNPAIVLGTNLMSGKIGWAFIYTIYEVIGSFLAAALFRLTRPEDFMVRQMEKSGHKAYLEGYKPSLPTKLASEFIGTFMLVLTVGLNVLGKSPSIAFSAASCLMCMIYALGDVSGGHFNPAVTLAVVVSRKGGCSPTTGLAYVFFQILAGIVAGIVYAGLHGTRTFDLVPKAPYTSAAAHILEFLFTFVIAITVLGTAVVKGINTRLSRNYYFALAIGFSVVAGGTAAGDVSGGSLNPAVSWGIAIPNSLNSGTLLYMFTFTVIELAGGLAAALVFQVTHAKQYRVKERPLY